MNRLRLWTVYTDPLDLGPGYAVRVHEVMLDGSVQPRDLLCRNAPTIELARRSIPNGAHNLGRRVEDDKVIAEVWV